MTTWEIILDPQLVEIYETDEVALRANREGRLTDPQRGRLKRVHWRNIRRYGVQAAIAAAIFVASLVLSLPVVVQGAVLLYMVWRLLRVARYVARSNREIREGSVRMYPGRLQKYVRAGIRILYCERGTFYNLPDREWNAFKHNERYRVFSTPRTNLIVGAHPVHRDEPLPEAWK